MIIRTESRVIRPYLGLEEASKAFSSTKLLIDGKEFEPGSIVLPESQMKSASISLVTGTNLKDLRNACDSAGVPHKSAQYVLVGWSRMFRKSSVVYAHNLSSSNFKELIEIDRLNEDRFIFNDNSGYELVAALILMEENKAKPLQVKLPGTWLGSTKFRLRPQNDLSSFSPLPLDKHIREKFGLKSGTYAYIDIQEDLLDLEDLGDAVVAYLDEDVLNLLLTNESEIMSIAIQTQFAVQTLFVIAKEISKEMNSSDVQLQDINPESGALRFIMRMSEECKIDANDLLEFALKNESVLSAHLESRFGLASKIQKLLKGN